MPAYRGGPAPVGARGPQKTSCQAPKNDTAVSPAGQASLPELADQINTELATIPIDLIQAGDRLRDASATQVEALAESIAEVGILSPITVFRRSVIRAGISVDGYGIVAGLHRVEACRKLGWTEIPAQVVELSELQRQIAECDENLRGPKLSKAETALFTRRRKQAYEALHPEARAQVRQANVRHHADENFAPAFATDTAAKTGRGERAVQLDAERGEKIAEDVIETIRGMHLDRGNYLDELKRLAPDDQRGKVESDLAAPIADRERKRRLNDRIIATRLTETERAALEAAGKSRREILSLACDPQNIREFRLAELGVGPDLVDADEGAPIRAKVGDPAGARAWKRSVLGPEAIDGPEIDGPTAEEKAANDSRAMKQFRTAMASLTVYSDSLPQVTIPDDMPADFGTELVKDLRRLTSAVNLFRARVENALVAKARAS